MKRPGTTQGSTVSSESIFQGRAERSASVGLLITVLLAVVCVAVLALGPQIANADLQYSGQLGSSGTGAGQLTQPADVTTDSDGNLYVAENDNRVQKFDRDGNFILMWGWGVNTGADTFEVCTAATTLCQSGMEPSTGSPGNGRIDRPSAITTGPAGQIYVVDISYVQEFSGSGTFQRKFAHNDFIYSYGIATDGGGNIYLSISDGGTVRKYDVAGNFLSEWGSIGSGAGQINSPGGLAFDSNNQVYLADDGNNRIQKLESDGTFVSAWGWGVDTGAASFEVCTTASLPCQGGLPGSGAGQLTDPHGVSIGVGGEIYVSDSSVNRLQVYDKNGNFIESFGSQGAGAGQFDFPRGVASDGAGNVYVADYNNDRVQIMSEVQDQGTSPPPTQPPTTTTDPPPTTTTDPPPTTTTDTTAPQIDNFKVSRKRLRSRYLRRKKRKRVTFKYELSEGASVKLVVKSKKTIRRCWRKKNGKRKCRRSRLIVVRKATGEAGANKLKVKVRSRLLRRGLYKATLSATDDAGNVSEKAKTRFRVVR